MRDMKWVGGGGGGWNWHTFDWLKSLGSASSIIVFAFLYKGRGVMLVSEMLNLKASNMAIKISLTNSFISLWFALSTVQLVKKNYLWQGSDLVYTSHENERWLIPHQNVFKTWYMNIDVYWAKRKKNSAYFHSIHLMLHICVAVSVLPCRSIYHEIIMLYICKTMLRWQALFCLTSLLKTMRDRVWSWGAHEIRNLLKCWSLYKLSWGKIHKASWGRRKRKKNY